MKTMLSLCWLIAWIFFILALVLNWAERELIVYGFLIVILSQALDRRDIIDQLEKQRTASYYE